MSWVMCMQCHFWEPCMQANSFNSSRRSEPSGCVCQEVIFFQPKPLEAAVVCHLCEDASPCWTCMCLAGRERSFLPTRQKALSTNSAVSPTKTSLRMLQNCLSLLSLPLINLPVLLAWPHKWLRMEINPLTFDLVLLFNHIYSSGPLQGAALSFTCTSVHILSRWFKKPTSSERLTAGTAPRNQEVEK